MISLALLLALIAPQAAVPAAPADRPGPDIVVTGQRLDSLKAAFTACAGRRCTTERDAAVALALANAQFLAGDYADARKTLSVAIARNGFAEREHPLPIAALLRSRAQVDGHLGEYDDVRKGMVRQVQLLRGALPGNDPNMLASLVQLGDTNFRLGYKSVAEGNYREALGRAEAAANPLAQATARLRLAALYAAAVAGKPDPESQRQIRDVLAPILTATDPALQRYSVPARLLQARVAERAGAKGAVDAVLRGLPAGGASPSPQLLSFEQVDFNTLGDTNCQDGNSSSNTFSCQDPRDLTARAIVEGQWVDVAFWITPEGGVRDIAIVRQSDHNDGDWPKKVVASVASRHYAPLAANGGEPGLYRIERYTLTAPFPLLTTGTRIRTRSNKLVLEISNITPG